MRRDIRHDTYGLFQKTSVVTASRDTECSDRMAHSPGPCPLPPSPPPSLTQPMYACYNLGTTRWTKSTKGTGVLNAKTHKWLHGLIAHVHRRDAPTTGQGRAWAPALAAGLPSKSVAADPWVDGGTGQPKFQHSSALFCLAYHHLARSHGEWALAQPKLDRG